MPRHAALLLLIAIGWLPATGQALVVTFSGTVDVVIDPESRLDGSVVVGTPVSGVYRVDPTPSGGAFEEVGAARLRFTLGSYAFDVSQDPHGINLLDDTGPPGFPVDIWQTRLFVGPQVDPALGLEPGGVGYGAKLEFFDLDGMMLDGSEPAPFVVENLADWDDSRLTFDSLIDDLGGGSEIGNLRVTVALTQWTVVPEPHSAALLAGGLLVLASQRRRRR